MYIIFFFFLCLTPQAAQQMNVQMDTSTGTVVFELYWNEAPIACRNFVDLSRQGYYDGVIFHRVIKDFMVQGGDPTG